MTTVEKVIRIVIWHRKCWDARIKPNSARKTLHKELVLNILSDREEHTKHDKYSQRMKSHVDQQKTHNLHKIHEKA